MEGFDYCTLVQEQHDLLCRFEQQLEVGDEQFEETHSFLRDFFVYLGGLAGEASAAWRERLEALLASGVAQEQRILAYWAAQA